MRILGIDPGTAIVGYSVLDFEKNKFNLIKYGCIYTDKHLAMEDRLLQIFNELELIIQKYSPEHMCIEELFFFKNNKTIISVGQARGVIILAGKKNSLGISSYTPLQVKMGITGYGKADKKQVQLMVQKILKLDEIPTPDDAADAIAVAVTHANSLTNLQYSEVPVVSAKVEKTVKTNRMTAKEFQKLIAKK